MIIIVIIILPPSASNAKARAGSMRLSSPPAAGAGHLLGQTETHKCSKVSLAPPSPPLSLSLSQTSHDSPGRVWSFAGVTGGMQAKWP
jgi:hypothetical protein